MLVVLDSNALIADWRRESNAFRLLLTQADSFGLALAVPEVVVQEASRQLEEQMNVAQGKLRKALADVSRVGVDAADSFEGLGTVAIRVSTWEKQLRSQFAGPGRRILPMPKISHAGVFEYLRGDRPPASAGRGYGDILVWETVVAALDTNSPTVLVSNDTDFMDSSGEGLSVQLRIDAGRRCPGASVELVPTVRALVETYILPNLRPFDHFWEIVNKGMLQAAVAELVEQHDVDRALLPVVAPGLAYDAWVIGVDDVSDIELSESKETPDGHAYFTVEADVLAKVEYIVDIRESAPQPTRIQAVLPYPPHLHHGVQNCFLRVAAEGTYAIGRDEIDPLKLRNIESG